MKTEVTICDVCNEIIEATKKSRLDRKALVPQSIILIGKREQITLDIGIVGKADVCAPCVRDAIYQHFGFQGEK